MVRLTEEDLIYMIGKAVQMLKEEVKVSDDFWQTLDSSASDDDDYESPEPKTEDMPNDDSHSDAKEIGDTAAAEVSEPKHDEQEAPADKGEESSTDVVGTDDNEKAQTKDTTGSQLGNGGDPFSQKIGDDSSDSEGDNGGKTDSDNDGWGDTLDSVIGGVIDDYKKQLDEDIDEGFWNNIKAGFQGAKQGVQAQKLLDRGTEGLKMQHDQDDVFRAMEKPLSKMENTAEEQARDIYLQYKQHAQKAMQLLNLYNKLNKQYGLAKKEVGHYVNPNPEPVGAGVDPRVKATGYGPQRKFKTKAPSLNQIVNPGIQR